MNRLLLVLYFFIGLSIVGAYGLFRQSESYWDEGWLLLSLSLWVFVLYIFYYSFRKPLRHFQEALAKDDVNKIRALTSNPQFAPIAKKYEQLQTKLHHAATFVKEIEQNNLDVDYAGLQDGERESDALSTALLSMRDEMKKIEKANQERSWTTGGLAKFGEILRSSNEDFSQLGNEILTNLVRYTHSNQGQLFVVNNEEQDDVHLELVAAYAFGRKKHMKKKVFPGEGLVGQAFLEQDTLFMTEIPDDYIHITSGLGDAPPRSLIIVPLKVNDTVLGMLEMASFQAYETYQIGFLEKLGESIASTIANAKTNLRTKKLLEESLEQAEVMRSQEEEMRQTMEELSATQEEMDRKNKEQEKLQQELQKELTLLNALMENIPDYIYFKNAESRFIRISKSMVKLFNASSPEELVGKSDFDFHSKENAEEYFKEEKAIMDSRQPILDNVVNFTLDGKEVWVSTTKMPLFNTLGKVVGTWGISKIITDLKKAEINSQKLIEELQMKEKQMELRQKELLNTREELKKERARKKS